MSAEQDAPQGRPRLKSTGTNVHFSANQLRGTQERAMGLKDAGAPHSYEQYAQSDASIGINRYTIGKISGLKERVVDAGTGTGEVFEELLLGGKVFPNLFRGVGIDVDRTGLEQAKAKLSDFHGLDFTKRVAFVQGSGEELPLVDGQADLVTCLNVIHLFDKPDLFAKEAFRVLGPGGDLLINTAYVKNSLYANKKSSDAVRSMFVGAAKHVEKQGYKRGATFDPARFTFEDYQVMLKEAGFVDINIEVKTVNMTSRDVAAIYSTHEFEDGALPGVPYNVARRALVGSIPSRMKRFELDTIDRNWGVITAKKPAANTEVVA